MVCKVITWYSYKGNSKYIVENINGPGSRVQGPGSRVQGPGFRIQGPGSWVLILGPALRSWVLVFWYAGRKKFYLLNKFSVA